MTPKVTPPGPNLTKVGTSPLLEWGRPTSPLQWTNGDGSRWRLPASGATCRRTARLQQHQPEWVRVDTKAPWRCEPQALNRERSRCAPMLNASLASSRRRAPVRSRLLVLLNSVGTAAVAPPERWCHLECATYDVPTTLLFS